MPAPVDCPLTLDELLLDDDFDLNAALARVAAPRPDGA